MKFRLLGPLEARHDGRLVDTGSRRQERCLLAVLLLDIGRTVPVTRLIDLLWGEVAPDSARGTIQTYVGRLRHALGPYGVSIVTGHDGYRIEPGEHEVDVDEFRRLADEAVGTREATVRLAVLDRALQLWRGPLLVDVADDRLRYRLGAGLEEQRLASVELRAQAQLELGLHDRVVAETRPLLDQHPARERLVGQLMTALYRCGRQADALEVFRSTRTQLIDEFGIEPGAELQALHQRVLRNDGDLAAPDVPTYVVRVNGQILPWNVGGHPALDFCNTFAGWAHDPPLPRSEWLRTYATLAVWAGYMDLVDEATTTALLERARRDPDDADAALADARQLRASLYAYLTDPDDRRAFGRVAGFAEAAARVSVFGIDDDGLGRWSLTSEAGLHLPVHAAASAAADLLADPRRFTIRRCPSMECGWLFLDQSGQRKWCSMSTCGSSQVCGDVSGPRHLSVVGAAR